MADRLNEIDKMCWSSTKTPSIAQCPSDLAMIGKAEVCKNCIGREACSKAAKDDPDQKAINLRMNAIRHKILILSGKGGVGKSSIAANLSMALGKVSKKVGLADLDICGPSLPKLLKVDDAQVISSQYGWMPIKSPHYDIKVMSVGTLTSQDDKAIIWRGPRKISLIKRFLKDTFWGRLDYLIFDTPPGTSDEHLTIVKALKVCNPAGAIIVATPQAFALTTIKKEIDFCRKMGIKIIGLIENMNVYECPNCQECCSMFAKNNIKKLADEYNLRFLASIPVCEHFVQCCDEGQSILDTFPDSTYSIALMKLAQEVDALMLHYGQYRFQSKD